MQHEEKAAASAKPNAFAEAYAAWPTRFYIVHKGKMAYIAQPDRDTCNYSIGELTGRLEQIVYGQAAGKKA